MERRGKEWFRLINNVDTICPFCGVGCRVTLRVSNGRVAGVYPGEGGAGEGKLCIKGWSAHEFIHHPVRLAYPMMREDRSQEFRRVSWDEALDRVAETLKDAIAKGGTDSVNFLGSAKCTNEDNYALQKFARAAVGTPHIDHCARLCHASTIAGLSEAFGSGAMTNSIEELEDADVVLVVGSNTTEQHPLIARRILRCVREKGGTLIVADPRRVDLAEFAHLHLSNRPGSDVALINGLLNVIIEQNLTDEGFIENHTDGFGEVRKLVEACPPERVEEITGVRAGDIVKAAQLFGRAGRATIVYAMGITQHAAGTDMVLALANLAMATGNVGKRSSGVNPLRGQNNVQGACDVGTLPAVYPGYRPVDDDTVRGFFEKAWDVPELPGKAGITLCEMMDAALSGQTGWMYIMGENPALSDPDSQHVRAALEKVDFLVVQDIFPTETTAFAHVILPGVSFAEKDGTFTSTERRVQRIRRAIEPVGEARSEWRIFGELAERMGYNGMRWGSSDEVFGEIARVTPIYGGISYERLDGEGIQWPCPEETHPGTPILHEGGFSRGRGRFVPTPYNPPPEIPDDEYPMLLTTGRMLFQFHTGTMTRRSPTLSGIANEAYVEINPEDADNLGIKNDQIIRVISRRGEICAKARATKNILRGVIFIPFHFAEAAANMLTLRVLDPKSKIPELKVCAVRVEAV
ncbi:MAG: formate dehydrogenase subunit alpha [Deltaproteobacteria bacterium]|nr:formate dehydrogenase subunit alpha [Deltaproteobacteria bacterium]